MYVPVQDVALSRNGWMRYSLSYPFVQNCVSSLPISIARDISTSCHDIGDRPSPAPNRPSPARSRAHARVPRICGECNFTFECPRFNRRGSKAVSTWISGLRMSHYT